jgi:head-tail adaptor
MAMRRGPFDPGERDRIITIQELSVSVDPTSGEPLESWSTLIDNVPASKGDIRGMERFIANQESSAFDARFEFSYRLDMDPDLVDVPATRRIVYQNRVHDIVSAQEIGRREGIECLTLANTKVTP